ncbi:hypothetical protein D3C73_1545610 [compost metagenome]
MSASLGQWVSATARITPRMPPPRVKQISISSSIWGSASMASITRRTAASHLGWMSDTLAATMASRPLQSAVPSPNSILVRVP